MQLRARVLLVPLMASAAIWSPAAFAQQVVNGAIPTQVSPTGVTAGVNMTGQGGGGSLLVGTVGGAQTDIFTNNSAAGIVTNPLLRAVSTDTSSQSNIVFNSSSNVFGAIGVTQPGGPFFLNVSGGNNGTVVNFNGNLYATITTVNQSGTLNLNSGSTNISATNFAGDGRISLAPNSTLIGALTNAAANTGTLSMGGGSVLTGAVGGATGLKAINVVGGTNAAGVTASISGAVNAYTFNLGTNRLNIGGALTIANQSPVGVINTTLASATVYGNIQTAGATNLGPTLLVNVAVPQTAFFPVGTLFNIVQTGSGTNGSVITVVNDPTNPLFTFAPVPLAGTVAGRVTIISTGIPLTVAVTPPAGVVLPPVQVIAAPVVPAVLAAAAAAAPTADLVTTVLPAINAISNATTVVNAVAQLAPSNSGLAASLVTFEGARAFQNLLSSHLSEGLCDGGSQAEDRRKLDTPRKREDESSGCPENNQYRGVWVKGFGNFGNQGSQGAFAGYTSHILGAMAGYDVAFNDDTRIGLGGGYAYSKINGKGFNNTTGFNTYQATAYVAHEDGRWFANGDISYGWNNYSGNRPIVFPGVNRTALAKYSGEDFSSYVTAGYHFFADAFTVTPLASLQATHVRLGGYTETGAGDINLQVAAQRYNFLESGLGANAARHYDIGDGQDLLPELHFKWLHELLDQNFQNSAVFTAAGSTPFVTQGMGADRNTLNAGAGVTLLSCACEARTWSVEAIYDFYWRNSSYTANQVTLAAAYRF